MTSRPLLDSLLADPQKALADIAAERARRRAVAAGKWSFAEFAQNAWPIFDPAPLRWNWYLDCLCAHLEAVARGKIRRLVGNGPPRFGKSNLFAICWPAWIWTWAPTEKFIFLSYSDNLAKEHSISCRRLLESEWYRDTFRPTWVLAEDRNTQNAFSTSAGGARVARSIRSGVTGLGATKVCVDDPLDADEAMTSSTAREEALRVVRQAVATRLNDRATGSAVILAHRVHVEDPSQWAINAGWDRFCVPMEYDASVARTAVVDGVSVYPDPRTEPGELIDPERFPVAAVAEMKLELGPLKSPAQLGQKPISHAEAGKFFNRSMVKFLDARPVKVKRRVRAWDLAATDGGGDWTIGVLLSLLDDNTLCVEDVVRGQWGPRDVRKQVKATAELDGTDVEITIPKDPAQAGKDQAQEYVTMLLGWTVHPRPPTKAKVLRAGPASAQWMAGNVSLVRGPWNEPFLQTLEAFPDPDVHDDDVDALGDAVAHVAAPVTTADLWAMAAETKGEAELEEAWTR
jgi:predicted phage terminase large subunit-like protein